MINLGMSMKKTKTAVFFCLVLQTVSSYELTCPPAGHWNHRASVCKETNKYVCLLETIQDIYVESCTGPRLEVDGFQTTINKRNFDKIKCSSSRYQPLTFTTEGNSECVFQKSMCSEEGQIVYDPNVVSTEADRGCICNFNEGYALISPEKNRCFCVPSNVTDCSCYKKTCASDEVLTQDYKCVRKVQIGYDLEDNKCKNIIRIGITDTEDDYKKEKVNDYEKIILKEPHSKASIAVSVLLLVMTVVFLLVWLFIEELVSFFEGMRRRKEKGYNRSSTSSNRIDQESEIYTPTEDKENKSSESEDDSFHSFDSESFTDQFSMNKPADESRDERRSNIQPATENITIKSETLNETIEDQSRYQGTENKKIASKDVVYESEENCTVENDNTSSNGKIPSNVESNGDSKYQTYTSEFNHPILSTENSKIEDKSGARNYNNKLIDIQLPLENVHSNLDTNSEHNLESDNATDNAIIITENLSDRGSSDEKLDNDIIEKGSEEKNNALDKSTINDKNYTEDVNNTSQPQCDIEEKKLKMANSSDEDSYVNNELNETSTVPEDKLHISEDIIEKGSEEKNNALDKSTINDKHYSEDVNNTSQPQCDIEEQKPKMANSSDEDSYVNSELNETSTVPEDKLQIHDDDGKDGESFDKDEVRQLDEYAADDDDGDDDDNGEEDGDGDIKEHERNKEGRKGS